MRTSTCWLAVVGLLACWSAFGADVSAPEWGPVTNNAQLSVSLKGGGKEIKAGQPIKLDIGFRNVSTNETLELLFCRVEGHNPEFSFVVSLPSGKEITLTPGGAHGSGIIISLEPGRTYYREFNLSRLRTFSEAGAYQITAKYRVEFGVPKPFQIVSRPLSVIIVADR